MDATQHETLKMGYYSPHCAFAGVSIRGYTTVQGAIRLIAFNAVVEDYDKGQSVHAAAELTPEMAIELANRIGHASDTPDKILLQYKYTPRSPLSYYTELTFKTSSVHEDYPLLLEIFYPKYHTETVTIPMDEDIGAKISLGLRLAAVYAETGQVALKTAIR